MRRAAVRAVAGLAAAGALVSVSAAIAVTPGTAPPRRAEAAELPAFQDCAELREWYADEAVRGLKRYGIGRPFGEGDGPGMVPLPATTRLAARAEGYGTTADRAVGNGPTGTNVQEAGVDEPDLVKTDGRRLITLSGSRLRIFDVTGDEPVLLGRLPMRRVSPHELLLVGDRVVVLGSARVRSPGHGAVDRSQAHSPAQRSTVTVVDIADPRRPVVERHDEVEGSIVSARESGGIVRIAVSHRPDVKLPQLPRRYYQGHLSEPERARIELRVMGRQGAALRAMPVEEWLPARVERNAAGRITRRDPLVACHSVRHPRVGAGVGTVVLLTLDPAARVLAEPAAVTGDGELVYASADRLYVATTTGAWFAPAGRPARAWPEISRPQRLRTQIHAFDVSGAGGTSYVASGAVDGTVLGQWAFSEYDGHLRVATTRTDRVGRTDSVVTVLTERGDRLERVGAVGGLGRTETIRAVRWFGDTAVVVTFRRTDPLYVVDLTRPTAPRVRGELKIPGYSAYLHPAGDGLLLGVGQDATDDGRTTGAQVSSFDLRDPDRPARLATHRLGRHAWTVVEHDSRVFTYLPGRRLAVMPVDGRDGSAVVAVAVSGDGQLRPAGRWDTGGSRASVRRVVPVDGDRLAAITDDGAIVVLRSAALQELGRWRP